MKILLVTLALAFTQVGCILQEPDPNAPTGTLGIRWDKTGERRPPMLPQLPHTIPRTSRIEACANAIGGVDVIGSSGSEELDARVAAMFDNAAIEGCITISIAVD